MTLYIWTCSAYRELTEEDRALASLLRQRGHSVEVVVWDELGGELEPHSTGLIRSTWDYHAKPDEFSRWLDLYRASSRRLLNDPSLVSWNMDKTYLEELRALGVPVVPTTYLHADDGLGCLRSAPEGSRWVFKPVVSASAQDTWAAVAPFSDSDRERLECLVQDKTMMMQPFVQEIVDVGEWSFVFFDDCYSHAVLKSPASGDFRVQSEFGGIVSTEPPTQELIRQAESIYSLTERSACYARLDAVERDGQLQLMELELIEPYLFLNESEGAVARFVDAIERRLGNHGRS